MTSRPLVAALFVFVTLGGFVGLACSSDGPGMTSGASPNESAGDDAGAGGDGALADAPSDAPTDGAIHADGGLPFACKNAPAPNPCPTPSGAAGSVTFCMRPQWSGVASVDVYGGFGQASDWSAPFLTLTNDGSGTFVGTTALANGTYPYVFRTHGSADGLVKDGQYLLDQENPHFSPPPAQAPLKRSVSAVTVPQAAAPLRHVRGSVVYAGAPQGCYSVDLEAGELRADGGAVVSEHTTANFAASAPDGTLDFPVAPGPFGIVVRFPFGLAGADAGYPASGTPSIGYARTGVDVAVADVTLDPVDVSYPAADYAALSPAAATATLPVTFSFTLVPGASSASVAVIATSIAGNDPAYWSAYDTKTSVTWDGTFGGVSGSAKPGVTYYWGTWQQRIGASGTKWAEESLLRPITFP